MNYPLPQVNFDQIWQNYEHMLIESVCLGMLAAWSIRGVVSWLWEAYKSRTIK